MSVLYINFTTKARRTKHVFCMQKLWVWVLTAVRVTPNTESRVAFKYHEAWLCKTRIKYNAFTKHTYVGFTKTNKCLSFWCIRNISALTSLTLCYQLANHKIPVAETSSLRFWRRMCGYLVWEHIKIYWELSHEEMLVLGSKVCPLRVYLSKP